MAVVLPPAQLDPEHLGARAERHVGEARQGELHVIAEGMVVDALGSEGGEASVDLRRDGRVPVVVVDEGAGCDGLLRRVEGAGGKIRDVDDVVVGVPVDVPGTGEIDTDGFGPALEAGVDVFAGVDGIARGERLEDMEGAGVAKGPRDEGEDGEEAADESPAEHAWGAPAL